MADLVQIRFDGDVVRKNRVSMRTLGNTLFYVQNALDRAYLDISYDGGVWKNARLPRGQRVNTEFLIELPEPGSFVQNFISNTPFGRAIIDRVLQAVGAAVDEAAQQAEREGRTLRDDVRSIRAQVRNDIVEPRPYQDIKAAPDQKVIRAYGDRSIVKEIDKVLSIIRSDEAGASTFDLTLSGTNTRRYTFNKAASESFSKAISERRAGDPVIYVGRLHQLDSKSLKGKFDNVISEKTSTLHFGSPRDVESVRGLLGGDPFSFIGCPIIEYGSFDPDAGDVLFVQRVNGRA